MGRRRQVPGSTTAARRAGTALLAVAALGGGMAAASSPAGALVRPYTVQASVDRHDRDPDGGSVGPSMSADGRYVAFFSAATDLVPGDRNGTADVFVRDLVAGTTTRVSVDSAGGDPNGPSSFAVISADGRSVAFTSAATDLVAGDTNGYEDVFVRDLAARRTVRVSVDGAGGDVAGHSGGPGGTAISATGRHVAFSSSAPDVVAGDDNGRSDLFVRDVASGTTALVDATLDGGVPADGADHPSISATGRYVAFSSSGSGMVPGDISDGFDVFVRDVLAGTTTIVSVWPDGSHGGAAASASISATGRYVAFVSTRSLTPGHDDVDNHDVFVRDTVAGVTERATVGPVGETVYGESFAPSISADGRYVAFESSSRLVDGVDGVVHNVYVRDLVADTTTWASVAADGGESIRGATEAAISGDGRRVAFASASRDIVPPDHNRAADVFVRTLR